MSHFIEATILLTNCFLLTLYRFISSNSKLLENLEDMFNVQHAQVFKFKLIISAKGLIEIEICLMWLKLN